MNIEDLMFSMIPSLPHARMHGGGSGAGYLAGPPRAYGAKSQNGPKSRANPARSWIRYFITSKALI
jgi:hypothetical protein